MRPISRLTEIRVANAADEARVAAVLKAAFPTDAEARLVRMLEADGDAAVSLVAEDDGKLVGHAMLSRMTGEAESQPINILALAPVAVVPDRQGEGVGGRLVEAAGTAARQLSAPIIFVLGEPGYYERFGYSLAAARPYDSPYAGDHWMALCLDSSLADVKQGSVRHAPAFGRLE